LTTLTGSFERQTDVATKTLCELMGSMSGGAHAFKLYYVKSLQQVSHDSGAADSHLLKGNSI
jgi:hypothetical protein